MDLRRRCPEIRPFLLLPILAAALAAVRLKAEIQSHGKARGLLASISFQGARLAVNQKWINDYYERRLWPESVLFEDAVSNPLKRRADGVFAEPSVALELRLREPLVRRGLVGEGGMELSVAGHVGELVADQAGLDVDDLADRALAEVEEIRFESSHDSRQIQGWVAKPPGFDPEKRYPLILEIHGGPFADHALDR
jgi:hypothetical protein